MNSKVRAILGAMSGGDAKDIPDLDLLYFLVKHFSIGETVELGVGKGYSTIALLAGLSDSDRRLHSYDVDTASIQNVAALLGCEPGDPPFDPWSFRQLPSTTASDEYEPGSVGFLFLNASQAYEDMKDDLAVWMPKMLPDGVICGHGYMTWDNPAQAMVGGVNKAVHEFIKEHDYWYNLLLPRAGRGVFVMWPKTFMGRGFSEPAGNPW